MPAFAGMTGGGTGDRYGTFRVVGRKGGGIRFALPPYESRVVQENSRFRGNDELGGIHSAASA